MNGWGLNEMIVIQNEGKVFRDRSQAIDQGDDRGFKRGQLGRLNEF